MKTINLQINWYVYSLQLMVFILLYVMFLKLDLSMMAKLIGGVGSIATMLSVVSVIFGKKYVHIDKAGFSYRTFSRTCYLHSDDIKALKVTKIAGSYILSVQLQSNKQASFPYWMANQDEVLRAAKQFDCALVGASLSEVKA
ncbi:MULTISPECIES: hypothetical protein [Pseudoalteromonas]|uniref:Uncharacterized protein n=1 Tax=Pseudoalteromonas obscura TaxID=3048491 RepID=A0ABT7ET56_9GAMM|nr:MULTISPECIES: hypothetical protein [Pseudoalteromonas]MBQ4839686.1 hypothetical protein [Pseudoalteromonas luteoviolacea]MDK2598234.1 hypothetical protein [Pseudoalteromonas sp. P94(2023)]